MLKGRRSDHILLRNAAAAAAAAMSFRPSPSLNRGGGRRGFSNRGTPNDDANYNPPQPPRGGSRFRPNQPPYYYSNSNSNSNPNPCHQPFYNNQNPHPHFNPPNQQQFRPPPLYNQQQQQQPRNIQQQQQFRPQQRFRRPGAGGGVSDYRNWERAKPGPPLPTCERFTILSYNILADYLAINHRNKLYFHIPRHILDWEFRFRNILFELGLWSADILCLQEVDRFQDLQENLKIRGYNGLWKMRTGEPVDGCAIFWRSSRFKLLYEEAIEFSKFGLRDNVAQICVLESLSGKSSAGSNPTTCSEGRNKVVVCNIHVLYNPKRGEIKLGQVRILLEKAYATAKLWDDAPVVLCGDYNSTPKSSLYNFIAEQKLNVSELPRDKISGQYSAENRSKRPFTSNFRPQLIDIATQSPTTVDNKGELSSSLLTDTAHKDEKTTPQLEAKEESGGSSVNCTSEILDNMSSDVITNDNNSDVLPESVEDVSVDEDSTSFLSELHGPGGTDMADDGADVEDEADMTDGVVVADGEPIVENQNTFYDPSGWTPMEIEAATGSSERMTMEHHLKLRSTYTEVEDCSGTRDSNGEPQVTSYHRGFQGTVDYIWRSEGLQTVRALAPIPKQAMEWTPGFPTKKWGSDHIALVAELAFNKLVDEEKSKVQ